MAGTRIMIHAGSGLYGKVDHVPGLFHVATEFFHINWVPLVPLRSHLIVEAGQSTPSKTGVRVPLSWKSVLVAWGRLGLLGVGCLVPILLLLAELGSRRPHASLARSALWLTLHGLSWVVFALSYRWTRARPERALELARSLGIPPETVARYYEPLLSDADTRRLEALAAEEANLDIYTP